MAQPASPQEIKSQVALILEQDPEALLIGIACRPEWSGPELIELAGRQFAVRPVRSVLEFRQQAVEAAQTGLARVCLTEVKEHDLGLDLVARLARRRLHGIDPWAAVKARLKAQHIDPKLAAHRHLAQALIEHEPPEGYRPVASASLSEDTAWQLLLRHALGVPSRSRDICGLITWASAGRVEQFLAASDELLASATAYFQTTCGSLASLVLACIRLGRPEQALTIGVVCSALFPSSGSPAPEQVAAAARLEQFVGNQHLSAQMGREWAERAYQVLEDLTREDMPRVHEVLRRADALLANIYAQDWAHHSDWSPLGLDQRLERLALELETDKLGPERLEQLASQVRQHRACGQRRSEQVDMAVRLARWLDQPEPELPPELFRLADAYLGQLAYVDWARARLAQGESVARLDAAYGRLLERAGQRRERFNQAYASALVAWNESGARATQLLPIENVLAEVVVPLVRPKGSRVLLIVLDGAAWSVMRELQMDLARLGWVERRPPRPRPVVTVFPSVTEASRTSLLTGQPQVGNSATEKTQIRAHKGLVGACMKGYPPVLYHKGDLGGEAAGQLSPELVEKIASSKHKLVGVVVNAIDDHLSRNDQLDFAWTVDSIWPLSLLLRHAERSGRVVVLASDHGHVLEHGTELRSDKAGGDRWRPGKTPAEDEVSVRGPRVLLGSPAILPWSERVRYSMKKWGYHGGATPQETLAPLVVTTPTGQELPDWDEVAQPIPDWWTGEVVSTYRTVATPRIEESGQFSLFEVEESVPASPRIESLLASPIVAAQLETAAESDPDPEWVKELLARLDGLGGMATFQRLGQEMAMPEPRLRGMVARAGQLTIVDGYPVLSLSLDGQSVVLNRVLVDQFVGPDGTVVEATRPGGETVRFTVPLELDERELALLEAIARQETITEKDMVATLGKRRAPALMQVLLNRLHKADWHALVEEGHGPDGRIYRLRTEMLG